MTAPVPAPNHGASTVSTNSAGTSAAGASVNSKETILVVDDEASIRRILETRLSMIGYQVVTASDGEEALEVFHRAHPDLVVLDVMMPKLDGYGVCQELRRESDVPIVMLTALGDVADRITGLELGADDYVVKPFSMKELLARVDAVLRRTCERAAPADTRTLPGITVDFQSSTIHTAQGHRHELSEREAALLKSLIDSNGRVVTREEILRNIWHLDPARTETRTIDMHVMHLRAKIGADLLATVRGKGYQLLTEAAR